MLDSDIRPLRDAQRTRAAILTAAQEAFSIRGYSDTGVRDITAAVGVNPALVSRYFGSKEGLYDAALITDIPRERFGESVVTILTASVRGQRNPLPMMMFASADPTARMITDRLLKRIFIEPLASWYGPERGAGKAACFAALASGLTLYRELYPLDALGIEMSAETRRWLVGAFQSLID
jgi:AcrR family transcriptional regulator